MECIPHTFMVTLGHPIIHFLFHIAFTLLMLEEVYKQKVDKLADDDLISSHQSTITTEEFKTIEESTLKRFFTITDLYFVWQTTSKISGPCFTYKPFM